MKGIVLDASVTLSWCFPDEQTPVALNVLDRLNAGEQALVPAFWSVEVLNSVDRREAWTNLSGTDPGLSQHSGSAGRCT